MGGVGYKQAFEVSYESGDMILEVGSCSVSDPGYPESSTSYLRDLAHTESIAFRPMDIGLTGMDAVQELKAYHHELTKPKVAFAYLDSWDWPYENMNPEVIRRQQFEYHTRGQELTKEASAEHHLSLAKEVQRLARVGCIITFDDTWIGYTNFPDDGFYDGKGKLALPYLMDELGGWFLKHWHTDNERNESWVSVIKER